jgi:hypothetical protein
MFELDSFVSYGVVINKQKYQRTVISILERGDEKNMLVENVGL